MKVLLSWLREFAPIEGDPVALAETMSALGLEVESIARVGEDLGGIVVARVAGLRSHPDADRIQLVDVDSGDGEVRQVCCGAFNIAEGDLVPYAPVGARIAEGTEISRRKIRGEWSDGMLCSAAELGLGEDASGIMVLSAGSTLGADLAEALGVSGDVLYDLEINPNRPDAMAVVGVARDLAAHLKVPFSQPEPTDVPPAADVGGATVEIVDRDACGRFVARVMTDVTVGPSPAWLANRLTLCGMRPINNVVDVSNYVMLELGQPNHPYDLALVAGRSLRVRYAQPGETLVTLDDVERTLEGGDVVICDGTDEANGIAGIMGGASSEISASTTEVLVEMAWWFPEKIAPTAKRLELRSEASVRFERGVDTEGIDAAMARFCALLAEAGRIAPGMVDERGDLPDPARIHLRTDRVNAVLGTELSPDDISGYLEPIGFSVVAVPDGHDVVAPTFRSDTSIEIDVIEEVARHHGYERIPKTVPPAVHTGGLTPRQKERRVLRRVLIGLGISEAMPVPFCGVGELSAVGAPSDGIEVSNPLSAEESVLRTSLRPGLLRALAYNVSHRNSGVHLFEIGHVFLPRSDGKGPLPDEQEHLGVVLAGADARAAAELWQLLADVLAIRQSELAPADLPGLHPTRAARLVVEDQVVGEVGEIDPAVLERLEISERVGSLDVDLGRLLGLPHGDRRYVPISLYPSSDIDLAFEVDDATPAAEVEGTIREAAGPLLVGLQLFDVFRGEQVGESTRSLAYALRLQSPDRTLTDEEIAALRDRVIDAVEAAHPAELRG